MQNQRTIKRKIGVAAASCLLILMLPVIIVLMIATSIPANLYSFVAPRWRLWRTGRRYYLICSPRSGWREFVNNNLLTAIPPGIAPLWSDQEFGFLQRLELMTILSRGSGLPKPCLVEIKPLSLRVRSLHTQLLPLKECRRKDAEVQQLLRKLFPDLLRS